MVDIKRYYKDEGEYIAEYDPTDAEMKECIATLLKEWFETPSEALDMVSSDFNIQYEKKEPKTFEEVVEMLDLTTNWDFQKDAKEEIEEYFNNRY